MSVTFTPGKLISIEYGGVFFLNNFDIEYDIVNTGREERGEAYEIPRLRGRGRGGGESEEKLFGGGEGL